MGFALFMSNTLKAQWTQTNGYFGGNINAYEVSGTNIFAGTDKGMFLSINNGDEWTSVNNGLGDSLIYCIAINGSTIFVGTSTQGIYKSEDNGNSWTAANIGLSNSKVRCMLINGTNIYAGTESDGVFLSTDNGQSWTSIINGLVNSPFRALASFNGYVYAGTNGAGVFRTNNNGNSWVQVNAGLNNVGFFANMTYNVNALVIKGSKIFAGTGGGLFSSTTGNSWQSIQDQYPVTALKENGTNFYAGTGYSDLNQVITGAYGVQKSTDNGTTWSAASNGISYNPVNCITVLGSTIFAGTTGTGVYKSNNSGSSWVSSNVGLGNAKVTSLIYAAGTIYAGTYGAGIYKSIDGGNAWVGVNNGIPNYKITSLALSGTTIFAGTEGAGLFKSIDNAATWQTCPLPNTLNLGGTIMSYPDYISSLHVTSNNKIFVGSDGLGSSGTYSSTNGGTTWALSATLIGNSITSGGSNIFIGCASFATQLAISNNNGFSWTNTPTGVIGMAYSLESSGSYLFVGEGAYIRTSPDNGNTWNPYTYDPLDPYPFGSGLVTAITKNASSLFSANEFDGVYYSNNNFTNATAVNAGLLDLKIFSLLTVGTDIYAGTLNGTVWKRSITEMTQPPTAPGQISGIASVCQGQNAVDFSVPLIANATSYVWTLPNGATGTSSTNSISVNFGGSAVSGAITVQGLNYFGAGLISTYQITVNQPSSPTFNQVSQICYAQTLNALPTTSLNNISGTWSPVINNTSTTAYTFTPTAGQCANPQTMTVTVNPLPIVTLAMFNSVCDTAGVVNLTGGSPAGGTYSGTSVSNNTFNTSIGVGTYPITYSYTDNNFCLSSSLNDLSVIDCNSVGLSEEIAGNFLLYPNPANDNLILESSNDILGKEYNIFDFSGRIILKGKINAFTQKIEITNISNGSYLFQIENESTNSIKFVKM